MDVGTGHIEHNIPPPLFTSLYANCSSSAYIAGVENIADHGNNGPRNFLGHQKGKGKKEKRKKGGEEENGRKGRIE